MAIPATPPVEAEIGVMVKGHMRKRGDTSWQLLVYLGRDENEKRRYASKTVRGTKRQAQLALAEFVTEVSKTAQVPSGPVTVSTVVRDWLAAKTPRLAPATVLRYNVARRHIDAAIGSIPVSRLRPRDIEDFYAAAHRDGLSGSSIRKIHWAMRQSLAWAKRRGLVVVLATDGIELPPLGERAIAAPRSADVRALVQHGLEHDADFGPIIAFVAWSGCRRGEACGLRWSDVDLDRGQVTIRRSIVAVPGGVLERGTKTGEMRRIAIGPGTVGVLREHREHQQERARDFETKLHPDGLVFSPDPAGRCPWHPSTISHQFVALCEAAGVPRMRMHDLRHHSATTLLKHGVSVGEVMDRHGWKTLEMVGRYRHLLEATDQSAAVLLEGVTDDDRRRCES